ncbi:MAG: LemA family protein [Phycisphaerales bacterium]|nr:MAG: LemA family protein [Phycisphaerales bacterium]
MKHAGQVKGVLIGIILAVVVLGVVSVAWYINGYNRAVNLEEGAKTAWSNVDTALQRRLDLIPNLVATVRGYAEHEKELFENIAKSREKYFQPGGTRAEKIAASNELSGLLSRLLMLQENYPQLKANENFLTLQTQLEGTENRINVARTRYNEAGQRLNSYTRQFFGSFFSRRAGVEAVAYFEATEQARTEVPKVDFKGGPNE